MESSFVERRRSPRVTVGSGVTVGRPVSMAVRLLDLSSNGVLLSCPGPIAPGSASRVTVRIGDQPLDAEVDVRHVSQQWDQRVGGYRVGGRFLLLAPQTRQAVERLLNRLEHRE